MPIFNAAMGCPMKPQNQTTRIEKLAFETDDGLGAARDHLSPSFPKIIMLKRLPTIRHQRRFKALKMAMPPFREYLISFPMAILMPM
ncbi:hypothetical protein N9T46_02275 [bacterium]|nr:hypothetical protein [bacterium]